MLRSFDQPFAPTTLNGATVLTRDLAPDLALPWVVRLRYGIACGEAAIIFGMIVFFRLSVPLSWTFAALSVVLLSNLLLAHSPIFSVRPEQTLGAVFVLDTLCLTAILALTGGPENPFSLLYLVQITLSAIVLRKAWTWALGVLATMCFGLLFVIGNPVPALAAHHETSVSPHLVGMWIAFIVAAGLITFFTGKVSDELRRREQEVLRLQEQIARHERLASLATLAAGAAHELGTPLATIAVVSRELERYASSLTGDESIREDARLIRGEVERCRLILQRMSAEGAEPVGEVARRILVTELFQETLRQFSEAERASLTVSLSEDDLAVVLPVQATSQSLAALIKNALDANLEHRKIVAGAARDGSQIVFSIADAGPGMSEAVLRRIAEPFFTTKEPGQGMGLGTFLVRTFAERLGGNLSFESTPGKGTTVTLNLPLNSCL
ncbi:MAG TPA: ATP-binding protein [Bryobacteraceae bacterium]|nr:ATP-binding protein [Bryobacteraceae bacterium]